MKIAEGKTDAYRKFLHKNIDSLFDVKDGMPTSYILGIMLATELIGESLDEGEEFGDAVSHINRLGLTGYMAGMAVSMLVRFHPKGEALRVWWNAKYGVPPEKPGTVNPAIVTINKKKDGKKNVN